LDLFAALSPDAGVAHFRAAMSCILKHCLRTKPAD
jgi:hypothetical protein